MKKTAILVAIMLVVISVTFAGCGNDQKSDATEPSATPIATVAPTAAPTSATKPTQQATKPTQQATKPTQAATFQVNIATNPSATSPTQKATDANGNPVAASEAPTASPNASPALGQPDSNGNYTVTGTVTGHGGSTVVIMVGDGSEYEFNYSGTGLTYNDIAEGQTVTIVSDGDPSGAGVPNALSVS